LENIEIAKHFYEIAEILDFLGDPKDRFRVISYSEAARTIEAMARDLGKMTPEEIDSIPGVGESIMAKIKELLKTGRLKYLRDLEKKVPKGVLELMRVPTLGPKKINKLYKELGIKSLTQLEMAAKKGKISKIPEFGKKTEENILRGIAEIKRFGERFPLAKAYPFANSIKKALIEKNVVENIEVAGSIRRFKEDIGDIDILVTAKNPQKAIEAFCSLPQVKSVEVKGKTKATVITTLGMRMDLLVIKDSEFGSALYYFTGSKDHNVRVRSLANKKGYSINEYGIYKLLGGKLGARKVGSRIGGKSEEEIFEILGMDYIEPELRENRGEIEAAIAHKLPNLVEQKDIRGDCFVPRRPGPRACPGVLFRHTRPWLEATGESRGEG